MTEQADVSTSTNDDRMPLSYVYRAQIQGAAHREHLRTQGRRGGVLSGEIDTRRAGQCGRGPDD
jgi:hypothetical protein